MLRAALRLSLRDFAAHLGVGVRTINKWEARQTDLTPQPHMQAILDTALRQATGDEQARFAAALADHCPGSEGSAPARSVLLPVIVNGRPVFVPLDADSLAARDIGNVLNALTATAGYAAPRGRTGRCESVGSSLAVEHGLASRTIAAVDLDNAHRIALALAGARHHLDGSVVDYFRHQLATCKADDGKRNSAETLPAVLGITLTDLHATITTVEHEGHGDPQRPHDDNHRPPVGTVEGLAYDSSLDPAYTLVPITNAEGRTVYVPTSRRDLLKGIGAGVGVAALSGHAAEPLDSGGGLIDHFRQMRKILADNDNLFGAHRVISVAADQLDRMHKLKDTLSASALPDYFHVQAEFADLLGWLYQDSGGHAAAQYWVGRALEFAHLSGNMESVAFILSRRSQLAADMRDPAAAVLSGEAGINLGISNPRITAISATQTAHGYALAGDPYNCEHAYQRARELLAGHPGDDSPWGQFFGTSYIDVYSAQSHSALGNYREAAGEYKAAIKALPLGFRRDQGVYMAYQAHAHAKSGEHDRAAVLGGQALAVNMETGSARGLRELVEMQVTLEQCDSTAARDLRSAIVDVTAARRKV